MPFETVRYNKENHVAYLELNRPEVINAFNLQMRDELYQLLEAIRDDPEIHVVVLTGVGHQGFSAGADLTEFGTAPSQSVARCIRWERDLWGLLQGLRKPIMVALHGYVIGTGLEMACMCDIRIASYDTKFRMPELSLGFIPGAGGTQTIPRTIGRFRAFDLFFSHSESYLTASEALDIGLIHRVTDRSKLSSDIERLANDLANRDQDVMRAMKTAVVDGMDMDLRKGLELEARLAMWLRGSL